MITSHRNQLRRRAARMLLVWLFGIFAGVANACVLGGAPGQDEAAAVQHSASQNQHGADGTAVEKNCQDFCAQASSGVPSQAKTLDQVATAAVPIGFATTALPLAPALRLQSKVPPHRNGAPPIPIAFLRLTL